MRALITSGILVLALGAGAAFGAAPAPRIISITATDALTFSLPAITAKPGEALRIVLTTKSAAPKMTMAHNFVLLAAGTDQTAFGMAAAMARDTQYIPGALKSKVLAATKLAGGGETVIIDFKVPVKAGKYTYVCSFPGHLSAGMKGTLTVR